MCSTVFSSAWLIDTVDSECPGVLGPESAVINPGYNRAFDHHHKRITVPVMFVDTRRHQQIYIGNISSSPATLQYPDSWLISLIKYVSYLRSPPIALKIITSKEDEWSTGCHRLKHSLSPGCLATSDQFLGDREGGWLYISINSWI